MKNRVEILAPAGSMEALKAALLAGANAVYLGGEKFSARAKAANFSLAELKEALHLAHLRNVKIYVTVNILLGDSEMEDALTFTETLYKMGVDGIIVQSPGFAYLVKQKFPNLEIHGSTQMTVNNYYGAKLLQELGYSRVVLARETPLEEVEKIRNNTDLEIEVFIHGALCVCYSGQCLMSSMIGGRSGNRGACAQPCRKSYEMISKEKKGLAERKYYLSPKDLNTLDTVKKIIEKGATSLKIEGRMKRPQYVYEIVTAYRKALSGTITCQDEENVGQIFNRGFTKGLYHGDFGKNFITEDRPDNRGIVVGRVLSRENRDYWVEFSKDIVKGDGLEFQNEKGYHGWKAKGYFQRGKHRIHLPCPIKVGSSIRRTLSLTLEDQLGERLRHKRAYRPLSMEVTIEVGKKPHIVLKSGEYKVEHSLDICVERAVNSVLTKEKIEANLLKLQDTIFTLTNINLTVKGDPFLRVSDINRLRRESIAMLEQEILKVCDRKIRTFQWDTVPIHSALSETKVFVFSKEQLDHLDLSRLDQLIIPWESLSQFFLEALSKQVNISISFQKIYSTEELEEIYCLLKDMKFITGLYLNNLSQVEKFRDLPFEKYGDIGLNIFNISDLHLFRSLGLKKAVLSLELSISQIRELAQSKAMPLEIIAYGRPVVMTMEHCPYALVKGCIHNDNCSLCQFKNYYLRDEKGVDFEVRRNGHLTEILNSYPIFLEQEVKELKNLGITTILLGDDFINQVISSYEGLKETELREEIIKKYHNVTRGHYYRGVMNE